MSELARIQRDEARLADMQRLIDEPDHWLAPQPLPDGIESER